jgi:hypothetical protein
VPQRSRQPGIPERSLNQLERVHRDALALTVLYTGVSETLAALREAAGLAFQLGATIRILVLEVVPYPLPLEHPRVEPEFRLRQFQSLWKGEPIETRIDVRLCRDARCCLRDELAPNSLVLVGERRTRWPFTREKRIARFLRAEGHQVIRAVGDSGKRVVAPWPTRKGGSVA